MITSRQNDFIKLIRSLSDKKNRDALNLFTVEGIKAVNEAVIFGCDFFAVIGTEKALKTVKIPENVRVEEVSDGVFECVSAEKSPQGVMAVIYKPKNDLVPPTGNSILLDGVADPKNVGSIIRTAVASNYKDVYLTSDSADAFSPKSVRASMTGIFRANIHYGSRDELLNVINKPLVIADMGGKNVFGVSDLGKICLVIGNEGNGVSQTVKQRATYTVSIPMQNDVESLNASVSAGILMYLLNKKDYE